MPTLREYRAAVAHKLKGFRRETVSLDPDITDPLAKKQVLCDRLYNSDRGVKGYSNHFIWVGKYKDSRRVRENGFRTLAYVVYEPPASGTYTITFYGNGVTSSLAFDADAADVETAVNAVSGLSSATVTGGDGDPIIISLSEVVDAEISAGTLIAGGGLGALEVNSGFTRALREGDEFEILSKLPAENDDNCQGLNEIINYALARMWFIDRFPLTPGTNSRGVETMFGLSGYSWLTHQDQVIALYNPTYWKLVSVFTPPASGTYTLTLNMGLTTYTTSSLAFDATGQQIQDALEALGVNIQTITASPLTANATYTLTFDSTKYGSPYIAASAGSVSNTITMLEEPSRYSSVWKYQYDGQAPYIGNYIGIEGESILIEAQRQAHTWYCPQESYGTEGSVWMATEDGLVDDYDQAIPSIVDVANVAYAFACDQMVKINQGDDFWANEAKEAHRVAAGVKWFDLPRDDKPRGGFYGAGAGWGNKGWWARSGY